MWMWRSILPGRSNASSSFSMWLVVNTKILSLPQHDHKPSVKFKRPERVILPPSALSDFVASCSLNVSLEAAEVNLERGCDRQTEQSMSSMTMMDLFVVCINSCFSSELLRTCRIHRASSKLPRRPGFQSSNFSKRLLLPVSETLTNRVPEVASQKLMALQG